MANQRIVVDIIGNDSSFQATLQRSQAAAAKFGTSVNKSLGGGGGGGVSVAAQFDPLLERVKRSRAQAEELSKQLKNMGDGFEDTARGAGQLNAGLLPLIGRASAVGFAINAAYTASRHLQDSLQTTGAEAFTTGGKLRNLAAALISGDIVAGFDALRAAPKTIDDLGITAQQAAGRLDALKQVAFGQAAALREQGLGADGSREALQRYSDIVSKAGTSNENLAAQLLEQGRAWNELSAQMRGALNSALAFRDAEGKIIFPGGFAGLQPRSAPLPPFGTPVQSPTPLGPAARRANALIVAEANQDLDEVLRLQTIQRDKLARAIENSHGNVKQRQELARNYALAVAAVITTQRQIKAQNDAAAKAAAEAAAQNRSDMWERIIGALNIGVDRARLTGRLNDDLARLEDLKAGLQRQVKAGVDVASAQSQLVQVTGQIADTQEQIRQHLADVIQAKQFRELGLSATGDEVTPSVANLAKRLKGVLARVDSGDLDLSSKLAAHLREAQKTIAKEGDELTRITRDKINEFLKAATGDGKTDQAFKFRVPNFSDKFKELGLTPQQLIAVRSAFSRIGPGGLIPQFTATGGAFGFGGGTNVGTGATIVNVNGNIVTNDPEKFIRDMQRKAQRTTVARTGPMSGRQVS